MQLITIPLVFLFNLIALAILTCLSLILLTFTMAFIGLRVISDVLKKGVNTLYHFLDTGVEYILTFIYRYKTSIFIPIFFFFSLYVFVIYQRTPSAEVVNHIQDPEITVYDRSNQVLYTSAAEKNSQSFTSPESLPPMIVDAVVASQDKHFFSHHGFDWQTMLYNVPSYFSASVSAPRYTISQQVAQYFISADQPVFEQFLTQLFLTYRLENTLSKKRLLGIYLRINQVGKVRGISTAANYYFDRPISQLNNHELLYLVSLMNRDQDSDQVIISKTLRGILQNLKDSGRLAEHDDKIILSEAVQLSHRDSYKKAPFITDYVLDSVFALYGSRFVTKNGMKIYTTIDLGTQNQLQQIVSENAWRTPGDSSVTLFIINTKNGEIIGGANSHIYNSAEEKKYLVERVLNLYTGLISHNEKPNPITHITDAKGKILYKNSTYYSPVAHIDTSVYTYNEMNAVFIGDFVVASVIHDPAVDKASYMYLVHNDILNAAKNRVLRTFAQPNQDLNAHR